MELSDSGAKGWKSRLLKAEDDPTLSLEQNLRNCPQATEWSWGEVLFRFSLGDSWS